jgi:hypothetical protein
MNNDTINTTKTNRVVNGTIVPNKNVYPWFCIMISRGNEVCGGSYIGGRYVLTAAHCLIGETISSVTIKMGIINLDDTSGEIYNVIKIVRHQNYNPITQNNDIAILTLDREPSADEYSSVLILPPNQVTAFESVGRSVYVMGFGNISNGGPPSTRLRDAGMEIKGSIGTLFDPGEVTSNMILAADFNGIGEGDNEDSCAGDSGGPLVTMHTNRFYQVGIVSWGIDCAVDGYPGVYTRVSKYINWIKAKTNKICLDIGIGDNTETINDKLPLVLGSGLNKASIDVNRGQDFLSINAGARHACQNRYIFFRNKHSTRLVLDDRHISLQCSVNPPQQNRTINYHEIIKFFKPNGNSQIKMDSKKPLHFGNGAGRDFTMDIAAGAGLINLVAGAKHKNKQTYRFFGNRGSSRINMNDKDIRIFISDNVPSKEKTVRYKNPLIITKNEITINGTLNVNGIKNFAIPHPSYPEQENKKLVHSCLEGPENGVYYRGESTIDPNTGFVTICLPNYFEDIVRLEGRTVQLTCKCAWFPLFVSKDGIKSGQFKVEMSPSAYLICPIQANQNMDNVAFFWEVKGIRKDVNLLIVEPK